MQLSCYLPGLLLSLRHELWSFWLKNDKINFPYHRGCFCKHSAHSNDNDDHNGDDADILLHTSEHFITSRPRHYQRDSFSYVNTRSQNTRTYWPKCKHLTA